MRSRNAKRLPADAEKLIGLSLTLFASGSRAEDNFWEARIGLLLAKVLRNGNQATLEAALDHLQQSNVDAYSALAELAEMHSELLTLQHEDKAWEVLLVAAPILAWTRYAIPSGELKAEATQALRTHLQASVLASDARVSVAPYLYSIDQLPRHHVETYRFNQQLAQAALTASPLRLNANSLPETSPILADPRFLLAAVAVPAGGALFRWQEEGSKAYLDRTLCLKQWSDQASVELARILPGCELECLLPDAYYSACRDADESIRPHMLNVAVRYLEDSLEINASDLRAVIGGFGQRRISEYRIGFTQRGDNDVLHGLVWPLYERENESSLDDDEVEPDNPLDHIVSLLKERGVTDIRRHADRFEPEYCEDCNAPLYADPLGEIVHAEMPEEAETPPPCFH